LVLVVVLGGVVLLTDLLRKWFTRANTVATLALTEGIAVAIVAAGFALGQLSTYRTGILLFGAFFILTMPFLWRDARFARLGEPPVRTVFPRRIGRPARVIWGTVALAIVAFYSTVLVVDPESFEWTTMLEVGIVFITTGYVAVTSRVPAWTAKVFGAHQETANEPGARAS
jgi:hypothetical protein